MLQCLSAKSRLYQKNEYIFHLDQSAEFVGVVLSGGCHVIQEDFWGNRTIVAHIGKGQLFGEAFTCADVKKLPVSVVATSASEILFIDLKRIVSTCSSSCDFHTQIILNMMKILANKNILLTQKIEHITKRTIRDKVLSYLSSCAVSSMSETVVIPFSRQELADYLGVQRSALSREISAMKSDGLLDYNKNQFTLKKQLD
ncbi:MAG: Crp/Fnr family transcriptional regulator [Clostridiales bacterium]|nr:Crp/Fnr family transcriptional regulator [Clostridiales bacterium]